MDWFLQQPSNSHSGTVSRIEGRFVGVMRRAAADGDAGTAVPGNDNDDKTATQQLNNDTPAITEKPDPPETAVEERKVGRKGVNDAKAKFYCEPCGKQYQTAMEWETHLSSYDHHHKKRWREMNQMVSGRTKKQRRKKEQKQLTRDLDAFAEQFERARREAKTMEASKPKQDSKTVTEIEHSTKTGMVFQLKSGKKRTTPSLKLPSQRAQVEKCDAFGDDSDE